MNSENDELLLKRMSQGDKESFAKFIRKHQHMVLRFAFSLTQNWADAEDIFQESFINMRKGAATFSGSSAKSWILTVTRNTLLREKRLKSGEPKSYESIDSLGLAAGWGDAENVDRIIESLNTKVDLKNAFGELSQRDREILFLRDIEGFSIDEVSKLLELELSAVKSRLKRARLRLVISLRKQNSKERD